MTDREYWQETLKKKMISVIYEQKAAHLLREFNDDDSLSEFILGEFNDDELDVIASFIKSFN